MGSVGNSNSTAEKPATQYNYYGFEVENTDHPDIMITDSEWEKMSKLAKYEGEAFRDPDLVDLVKNKMYQLGDDADEDSIILFDKVENSDNITDDEYFAGYHVLADWLGISSPRFTVLDRDGYPWDERYSSAEQAETWAVEHDDAKYVYDRWTHKVRTIGGKQWRKF